MALLARRVSAGATRSLVGVLLLTLVLSACGHDTPRVTADDGRDLDRPSGEIWTPDARDVGNDPGQDEEDSDQVPSARITEWSQTEVDGADEDPEGDGPADSSEMAPPPSPPTDATPRSGRGLTALEGGAGEEADEERTSRGHDDAEDSSGDAAGSPDGASSGGTGDRDDDVDPGRDDAPDEPEVVGACGVERGSAEPTRDEVETAVVRLRGTLAERYGTTQAGAWIVEQDPLVVQVGFTEQVRASLHGICDDFEHPALLEGVRVEVSESQLHELAAQMRSERDALRDGRPPADLPEPIRATDGRYAVGLAHEINGLRVTLAQPEPSLEDAFRDHYTDRIELIADEVDDDELVGRGDATASD